MYDPFGDPIIFVLTAGLLTSKKEECMQYAIHNAIYNT